MEDSIDFYEILDKIVKDITKRVAQIDLINSDDSEIDANHSSSLIITTHGDYILTIILHSSNAVLRGIAQNMKHGAAIEEGDIAICATEFFNVLCGHVISAINRMKHADVRFSIPQIVEGVYAEEGMQGKRQKALDYRCYLGGVKVEMIF